jgi:hypothetical protein
MTAGIITVARRIDVGVAFAGDLDRIVEALREQDAFGARGTA